jgi:hypothetical protein
MISSLAPKATLRARGQAMPKLLRSSETSGCGATIELDSGEVVFVSIAQTGVLVRSIIWGGGLIKSLVSNFTGPTLYNESNVYKNAEVAIALRTRFPDEAPGLSFKNPVLAAFANSIWHCSSAAEVSILLNETLASPRPVEDGRTKSAPEPRSIPVSKRYAADLIKRPITHALLLRAEADDADHKKQLNSLGLQSVLQSAKVDDTSLAEEIQSAVLIDALRLTNDAKEAIGLKWKPFLAGDLLPPHTNTVAIFGLSVTLYILAYVRREGHEHPDDNSLFPRFVNLLFLLGTNEEKIQVFQSASKGYNQILKSDAPKVREWRENLNGLVFVYLKDPDSATIKQRGGFPTMFGFLLSSLISAEE